MRPLLAELGDPGGISLGEAIAKFFKLAVADLDIPGGFDGAPALLKLGAIGLGEMSEVLPIFETENRRSYCFVALILCQGTGRSSRWIGAAHSIPGGGVATPRR